MNLEVVEQIAVATRNARDTLKALHETIRDAKVLNKQMKNFMSELHEALERRLEGERKAFLETIHEMEKNFIQMMVDSAVEELNKAIAAGALFNEMDKQLQKALKDNSELNINKYNKRPTR